MLKRLELFWKPDVRCGLMSVYTDRLSFFFFHIRFMYVPSWLVINSAMVENAITYLLYWNTQRWAAHNSSGPPPRFCPRNLSVITILYIVYSFSCLLSLSVVLIPRTSLSNIQYGSPWSPAQENDKNQSNKGQREEEIRRSMGNQSKE